MRRRLPPSDDADDDSAHGRSSSLPQSAGAAGPQGGRGLLGQQEGDRMRMPAASTDNPLFRQALSAPFLSLPAAADHHYLNMGSDPSAMLNHPFLAQSTMLPSIGSHQLPPSLNRDIHPRLLPSLAIQPPSVPSRTQDNIPADDRVMLPFMLKSNADDVLAPSNRKRQSQESPESKDSLQDKRPKIVSDSLGGQRGTESGVSMAPADRSLFVPGVEQPIVRSAGFPYRQLMQQETSSSTSSELDPDDRRALFSLLQRMPQSTRMQTSRKIPCKARGMPDDHNREVRNGGSFCLSMYNSFTF
jgi:hypothetical protein